MSDDLVKQLRGLASRTHDINDHTSLHLSADEIERLCTLLAFRPPAEDVRRLAIVHASGLAVVPVKPTEAMLAAGNREIFDLSSDAVETWTAMLAVSKEETER
tara:strand:- start:3281 stop:3589 length:309 start_codon:yes stop_codon:yes gene_type:complete